MLSSKVDKLLGSKVLIESVHGTLFSSSCEDIFDKIKSAWDNNLPFILPTDNWEIRYDYPSGGERSYTSTIKLEDNLYFNVFVIIYYYGFDGFTIDISVNKELFLNDGIRSRDRYSDTSENLPYSSEPIDILLSMLSDRLEEVLGIPRIAPWVLQ